MQGRSVAKLVVALLAAVVVVSLSVFGFATTFGSSTLGLGADSRPISACRSGMIFAYKEAFDAADSSYIVNDIELSSIPVECRGKRLSATFYDRRGALLGSTVAATLTTAGTAQSIPITPPENMIDANKIDGVSVVVG